MSATLRILPFLERIRSVVYYEVCKPLEGKLYLMFDYTMT